MVIVQAMFDTILPADGPHTFAGNPLDRGEALRGDADKIAEFLAKDDSRFACFHNLNPLLKAGDVAYICWVTGWAVNDLIAAGAVWVFLGLRDGRAHFAVDVSSLKNPDTEGPLEGLGAFLDMRAAAMQLDPAEAGILAHGKALIDWHLRHHFCAVCGTATEMRQAGSSRNCTNADCGAEHFPRTDPVVIMLALHGDTCLLGRQSMFPAKMFSALAGFIEQGENLEEAVRREIWEEAGVKVGAVKYHSSQPWPFPSSLMIGCHCEALTTDIDTSSDEIDEAYWFDKATVRDALAGNVPDTLWVPPPFAIAHQLLRSWAEGED